MKHFHILIALAVLMSLPVWAGEAAPVRSAEEIKRALKPLATRGLPEDMGERAVEVRPSIALKVPFAFNSALLTPDGEAQLDELARALQSPELAGKRYGLDGHTDGAGADDYNQRLSEKRANTVKTYLVERYGIPLSQLVARGFGESRLLIPDDPASEANRRVEVSELP